MKDEWEFTFIQENPAKCFEEGIGNFWTATTPKGDFFDFLDFHLMPKICHWEGGMEGHYFECISNICFAHPGAFPRSFYKLNSMVYHGIG